MPAPAACPACGFAGIRYCGLGTQRLEAEVRARFPDVAALRMDTDTMQAHGSHERALEAFRVGQGADPAGHADDRQGARLSQRHAGRA